MGHRQALVVPARHPLVVLVVAAIAVLGAMTLGVKSAQARQVARMCSPEATTSCVSIYRSGPGDQCLDSNDDGAVYGLPCNGGDYQVWLTGVNPVISTDPANPYPDAVAIVDWQTGRCLAAAADSSVRTVSCDAPPSDLIPRMHIVPPEGFWDVSTVMALDGPLTRLRNRSTGECLKVEPAGADGLGFVHTGTCDTDTLQDWRQES